MTVPTYNATLYAADVSANLKPEFGDPFTPVLIREADGVRIVLGTHDYEDMQKPDIQIERQPNGWIIFLHPLGGSDPSGYVYFLDDGRSFVRKELDVGPTEPIEVLSRRDNVPGFDEPI